MNILRLLLISAASVTSFVSHGATGPVVSGPENIRDVCDITLDPGAVTSGNWSIDWGDGATSTVPVSQLTATHAYSAIGSYEIKAVLRNSAGTVLDSQYSYRSLVEKTGPLLHYNFEDEDGTQHIGPSIELHDPVTTVPSFAASSGNALRLGAGGYVSIPGQVMKDADFFGVEAWVKPNNFTTRQMIYAGVGTATGNARVYIENNQLCFDLTGSGDGVKSVALGFGTQEGRWHHIAVSYERSPYFPVRNALRFYQDGFLLKELTYTPAGALAVNYSGATIGAHNIGTVANPALADPLTGDIDEVVLHRLGVFPGAFLERYRAATSNRSAFRVTVGPDGSEEFVVNEPNIIRETEVRLDPNPAVDNAPRIRVALRDAAPGTRVKLINQETGEGGGRFHLRSSYDWGLFNIKDKEDLELDGNGADFVASAWNTNYIRMSGSTRVAVKNLSFDIDQTKWRVGAYAQVQSVDTVAKEVHIRWVTGKDQVPDVVPKALKDGGLWRWRRVEGDSRLNVKSIDFDLIEVEIDPTDGSLWTLGFGPTKDWDIKAVERAFTETQAAGDLLQVNNVSFDGWGVTLTDSHHVTFDGLKLYGCAGMAFNALHEYSHLKVINSKIGLPPGLTAADRPFATGSDGFHFHAAGPKGYVWFENNDVGMTDDDPISLKGGSLYGKTYKRGDRQIEIGSNSGVSTTYIELRKPNLEPLTPRFEAYVVSYDPATDITTLDREVPGSVGNEFVLLQLGKRTENYVIRGSNIHDLNGRMMIYNPGGTIANNRFGNLLFHMGFTRDSYEACGPASNVVLQNNFFNSRSRSDIRAWGQDPDGGFEDISFVNNSFMGTWWNLCNTDGPSMTHNYLERVNQNSEAGRGVFHFHKSLYGTVFGNIHYSPMTTKWCSDAKTLPSYKEGANELIPHRDTAADVIVDNGSALFTGSWGTSSTNVGQFHGTNYRWSNTANATAQYSPTIPTTGTYRVYVMANNGTDRGTKVPYTITHANGVETVSVSQRTGGGLWQYLGTYTFNVGTAGNVKFTTTGAGGLVIADAVRFQQ